MGGEEEEEKKDGRKIVKNKTRIDKEGYILYSLAARCFSTFPRAELHRLWYARQGEKGGRPGRI